MGLRRALPCRKRPARAAILSSPQGLSSAEFRTQDLGRHGPLKTGPFRCPEYSFERTTTEVQEINYLREMPFSWNWHA